MLHIELQATIGSLHLNASLPNCSGVTVVIGPNGAGKSSLLKSLLGELKPQAGCIQLGPHTLFESDTSIDVPTEMRKLGYVPQRYALFPHMKVIDNVGFGIRRPKRDRHQRALELLTDLGVAKLAHRLPGSLSGGEAQRVALARALAIEPRALLLDEPMAALDAGARRAVRTFLAQRLRDTPIPSIVVSHDIDDAETLGDQVAVLEAGRVVQVGSLATIRQNPASEFVRQFCQREA